MRTLYELNALYMSPDSGRTNIFVMEMFTSPKLSFKISYIFFGKPLLDLKYQFQIIHFGNIRINV